MTPGDSRHFLWGVSTSAHQVEGNTHNDWTRWEETHASMYAKHAKKRVWSESLLKAFPSPLDQSNYISGNATEHFTRFREDIERMKELGINACRFSIEWSRIEPAEGAFDERAIAHYREYIHALREKGIEPVVTLWHWTHPLWFSYKGGWRSPYSLGHFTRFVDRMASEFRSDVRYWIPLNEPGLWVGDAYFLGRKPPGEKNVFALIQVYFRLIEAHRSSYRALKAQNPAFQVGIAESAEYMKHGLFRPCFDYFRNFFFVRCVLGSTDFIGVNYYKRVRLWGKGNEVSQMGWEIYPEGLGRMLKKYARLKKPLYVTENGIADSEDVKRASFLRAHIQECIDAKKNGIDLRGYFHWSFIDNFEWEHGFWPRFGLYEVNYRTQERILRESGRIYREIITHTRW